MKKFKMMALTGVLLSSTILGANVSVVQAKDTTSSNKEISVDKSSLNNAIQVINELLDSKTTANKVNLQKNFSDFDDGDTLDAEPIFGEKSNSEFAKELQSELNVVDDNGQLVPMTVVERDSNGFATEVSYTLDGTTKTVKVNYNYNWPTVSFSNGSVMNYDSADGAAAINASIKSLVTAQTTNKANANGQANTASLSIDPAANATTASQTIQFTPSDMYSKGITASGTVNVYSAPTVPSRTVATADAVKNPFVFVTSSGQRFLATPTDTTDLNNVKYTVTAIDSAGNTINDSSTLASTPKAISYDLTGKVTVTANTDSAINYTLVLKDAKTGNIVYTKDQTGKDGDTIDGDTAVTGTGYSLKDSQSSVTLGTDTTEVDFKVTKKVSTPVTYYNVTTGEKVGTGVIDGNNGSTVILSDVPSGYQLTDLADFMQTVNADVPSKNIYVKPVKTALKNLSYTVTFRDKDTGKKVGTEVNSQGNLGDYIGLTAPDGYAFATVADHGFLLLKNNQNVTKYVKEASTPFHISYVDQDTGKEVGTQSGKGADGSEVTLTAPDGYAFVNADDVTYKIDSDTTSSTVYVKKSNQTVDNIVSGYPNNGYIKIYDADGKLNDDLVLSEGSSWIIDQTKTINGAEYYRVATDEYVKASDVYKYTPLQSIAVTNGTNVTPVYNSKGQLIIDRALAKNTPWYTDRSATIKGNKMYRVATDEWVKDSDVTIK